MYPKDSFVIYVPIDPSLYFFRSYLSLILSLIPYPPMPVQSISACIRSRPPRSAEHRFSTSTRENFVFSQIISLNSLWIVSTSSLLNILFLSEGGIMLQDKSSSLVLVSSVSLLIYLQASLTYPAVNHTLKVILRPQPTSFLQSFLNLS